MKIIETGIPDLVVLEPKVFIDERGYFFESYNEDVMKKAGVDVLPFVQDNQSKSSQGVLRGLHYQLEPFAQTKLVRVLEGKIFDVAVDIRKESITFGKWFGVELSADNKKQLYIPRGFAHGFSVLSATAVVFYKCDGLYNFEAERGIAYNDPALSIDWNIDAESVILSEKDQNNPKLDKAEMNFTFG